MIRRKLTAVILAASFFILIPAIFAEGTRRAAGEGNVVLTENAVIDGSYDALYECDVTLRNLLDYYSPEVFSGVPAVNREYFQSEFGVLDDMYTWQFGNGCELYCSCFSLSYGNADMERYNQLLTYMDDANIKAEADTPEGFPVEDALSRCDALFRELMIENLVPDQAIALPYGYIRKLTDDMVLYYSGAAKLDIFHNFDDDISAWYLTFRQQMNGLKSTEDPQVSMIMTKNGIALLTITNVIERTENAVQTDAEPSWQDALDMFTALHGGRVYEEYSEKFEIAGIRIGYDIESASVDNDGMIRAKVFPCWRVDGTQILEVNRRQDTGIPDTKTLQISETYRISGKDLILIRTVGGITRK